MVNLTSVREGDIVEVDIKGRRFFARVDDKDQTGVCIKPITAGITWRHATARQVIGHYRRSKQSQRPRAEEEATAHD